MASHKSSKKGKESCHAVDSRESTLYHRLRDALNLGLRNYDPESRKWKHNDVETQKLIVRAISGFMDVVSVETTQHLVLRDLVGDMVKSLEGIFSLKNEAVLCMAADVAVKLVSALPCSLLQPYASDLIYSLCSLLSFHHLHVATSYAIALRLIIDGLDAKRRNEAWKALEETQAVECLVHNIRDIPLSKMPDVYIKEMFHLLSSILLSWPYSRYHVYSDTEFVGILASALLDAECLEMKVVIIRAISSLALCGHGAMRLLEVCEAGQLIKYCVDNFHPELVRIEGLRLANCFVSNEEGCSKIMSMCLEPIVKAVISGISQWTLHSGKLTSDAMSLSIEACRFALILRWAGEHHKYFWKLGIDKVLVDLLMSSLQKDKLSSFTFEEQVAAAREGLCSSSLQVLRPYIWDIIGSLAMHCENNFDIKELGDEFSIRMLILCVCLTFVDSVYRWRRVSQNITSNVLRSEAACRTVMILITSPSDYLAAQTRKTLFEVLHLDDVDYLGYLLNALNVGIIEVSALQDPTQTVINLTALACLSGLPQYQKRVIESEGINIFLYFIKSSSRNLLSFKRRNITHHLDVRLRERTCCRISTMDWEGSNLFLFFSLCGLANVMNYAFCERNLTELVSSEAIYNENQILHDLYQVCSESQGPGPRWYGAYILSYFGIYGFPNTYSKRLGKLLLEEDLADIHFVLVDGKHLPLHGAILVARCLSLLPPELHYLKMHEKSKKELRLSAHVEYESMLKLLEYVYMGCLVADDMMVKKLKVLARRCELLPLVDALSRRRPKWGTPVYASEISGAMGSVGSQFSDIILESQTAEVKQSLCSSCSLVTLHIHVHKAIIAASCDYLWALFKSGMQESLQMAPCVSKYHQQCA